MDLAWIREYLEEALDEILSHDPEETPGLLDKTAHELTTRIQLETREVLDGIIHDMRERFLEADDHDI